MLKTFLKSYSLIFNKITSFNQLCCVNITMTKKEFAKEFTCLSTTNYLPYIHAKLNRPVLYQPISFSYVIYINSLSEYYRKTLIEYQ